MMFNSDRDTSFVTAGTTTPIYVARDSNPQRIRPGESYFFVQFKGAQSAFSGQIWDKVKRLIVTSQVALNHPILGTEPLRAIQRSRDIQKNRAEQLGLSQNLIRLVPAVMDHVSISIEFILDKENHLAALGGLINDDTFLAAISLAPGAAMVARTVGSLSQKILQTFIGPEERKPILQFSGDFNIADGLLEGYYIILGTRDPQHPIPNPLPTLEVVDGFLLADGARVTQLSYIIFDIKAVPARTRYLNEGAMWDAKLRHAEAISSGVAGNPLLTQEERKQSWRNCINSLKEAQVMLLADHNYLSNEAQDIIKAAYTDCYMQVFGERTTRSALSPKATHFELEKVRADREMLNITPDEDLLNTLDRYAEQVAESRRIIQTAGL
jgi:hypothetical protein